MNVSPRRRRADAPVSKLFLSCDLTGSTAFKQRRDHHRQAPWQKAFLQFYREFPQTLRLLQADPAYSGAGALRFDLWKPVGDELIFTCDILRESDVFEAVRLWVATMREYKHESLSDEKLGLPGGASLGVKGGAFIATFPGPDSESSIPRNPDVERSAGDVIRLNRKALSGKRRHSQYLFDYFGPSIDTGFRVLSRCSGRYFALSVEVAYVLSSLHTMNTTRNYASDDIVLIGGTELKGVWGGREYPVFALDLELADEVNQAFASFTSPKTDISSVLRLCRACYSSEKWPFRVYLPESAEQGPFRVAPQDALHAYIEDDGPEVALSDPENPNVVESDENLLS